MRVTVAVLLAITLLLPTACRAETGLIEAVSKQYSESHPGLASYRVKLKTNKIDEMLGRMTSSMPPDVPRPEVPNLIKFWDREAGTVVRPATTSPFPYMQQMIDRFSQRFAIDLGTLFLPASRAGEREQLLRKATVKSSKSEIADRSVHHVEISFSEATDIAGAFYGIGLDLPQRKITRLELDIDPQKRTLVNLEIASEESAPLTVAIRHFEAGGHSLPSVIAITSPDGSTDEKFTTTFREIKGYHLPVKQERSIRRPGLEEYLLVEFFDYELKRR